MCSRFWVGERPWETWETGASENSLLGDTFCIIITHTGPRCFIDGWDPQLVSGIWGAMTQLYYIGSHAMWNRFIRGHYCANYQDRQTDGLQYTINHWFSDECIKELTSQFWLQTIYNSDHEEISHKWCPRNLPTLDAGIQKWFVVILDEDRYANSPTRLSHYHPSRNISDQI